MKIEKQPSDYWANCASSEDGSMEEKARSAVKSSSSILYNEQHTASEIDTNGRSGREG